MKIAILTLALNCLAVSYYKVSASGHDWAIFTPPKQGSSPIKPSKSVSYSERCTDQGYKNSYPQPDMLGSMRGTRKCYDYCYSLSYVAAACQDQHCKCLAFNPKRKHMSPVTEEGEESEENEFE
jgi:hypothetical protein